MDAPHSNGESSAYKKIARGLIVLLLGAMLTSYGALWTLAIANEATNAKQSADIAAASDLHLRLDARLQRVEQQLNQISQQLSGMAKDVEWLRAKNAK